MTLQSFLANQAKFHKRHSPQINLLSSVLLPILLIHLHVILYVKVPLPSVLHGSHLMAGRL